MRTTIVERGMNHFRPPLTLFTSCAVLALASSALADPTQKEDHYSYHFETQFLDGDSLTGDGPTIRVRQGSTRVLLIRPRTSFVHSLIKTAENL